MVAIRTPKVPAKWRKLFKLIPNYDPFALAGDCRFDELKAQRPIDFFAKLRHAKECALVPVGSPFILEPWQQAAIGCFFGWVRLDGNPRYQEMFLYVPKKNGKTALAAGIVLFLLVDSTQRKFGDDIFSAAAAQKQAALVFAHVTGMIRQDKTLTKCLDVYGSRGGSIEKSVVYQVLMSSYKCLTADAGTVEGVNVRGAVIDELHCHEKPELASVLRKSTITRADSRVIMLTTADYDRPSICNDVLEHARAVCENTGDPLRPGFDDAFLPILYEAAKNADITDPAVWEAANPNFNVTIFPDKLKRQARLAVEIPRELNEFKRLHLNIQTSTDLAFIPLEWWDKCVGDVDADALRGQACYGGMDLGATSDMTALVLAFKQDDGKVKFLCWFWVPEAMLEPRSHKYWDLYVAWKEAGYLHTTPGNILDYGYVRKTAVELHATYAIQMLAVDPKFQSLQLACELKDQYGLPIEFFGQGIVNMDPPTKALQALAMTERIEHGNHPILRWMVGNTVARTDVNLNLAPNKKKSSGKIDGVVCAIMALGEMEQSGDPRSAYEDEIKSECCL